MATSSVVTAADLALGDRLHLWGDMVWRLIGGLESDAFGDENFHGAIEHGEIGHSKLRKLAVTKHRVVRTPGRRGISRLACETALAAFDSMAAPAPLAGGLTAGTADRLADLLLQSLLERNGQDTSLSLRTALRDRADAYIRRNLADPALSVAGIAAALNCSKRHLHNAFAAEADSVGAHLLNRRLEACRRDLEDARGKRRSIAEIALSWGFNNAAHFSRVFRDRYGHAPRDYRAASEASLMA